MMVNNMVSKNNTEKEINLLVISYIREVVLPHVKDPYKKKCLQIATNIFQFSVENNEGTKEVIESYVRSKGQNNYDKKASLTDQILEGFRKLHGIKQEIKQGKLLDGITQKKPYLAAKPKNHSNHTAKTIDTDDEGSVCTFAEDDKSVSCVEKLKLEKCDKQHIKFKSI